MKRSLSISVLTAALMLAACKSDEAPTAEPQPEPAPATPAPEPAAEPEPEPTAEQIPIPDDFEDEARQEVTADTLRAELDALEKEISPDGIPN